METMDNNTIPVIQILSKFDYAEQHVVSLPEAIPLPPLLESSIRVKTALLSLTINNISYARHGHLFGWWNVHPLPSSTPSAFSDPTHYGRISAWGYGRVLESNVAVVPPNAMVYGYLPIGTLPVDLRISPTQSIMDQIVESTPHRKDLWPLYNRYMVYPPSVQHSLKGDKSLGWDSLMQTLYESAYLVNNFCFSPDAADAVHPLGLKNIKWTKQDADLADAVVIIFAASGKTALSFAYQLRSRNAAHKPHTVIGVTSPHSQSFTQNTGFYDSVVSYDGIDEVTKLTDIGTGTRIVLCDFGARDNAAATWWRKLQVHSQRLTLLSVGSEPRKTDPPQMAGNPPLLQANASGLRDHAMAVWGEERYFRKFLEDWRTFKEAGAIPNLTFEWGQTMDDVGAAWQQLCMGEVGPETGLLFAL